MDIFVQFGQVSHLIDLLVNNSHLKNFNKVLYHHFKFFKNDLKLEVLNQILLKRIGMNYGIGSSVRKRYFSDINYLLKQNYIKQVETYNPTESALESERVFGRFEYSKMTWSVSENNSVKYDLGSDVEPQETNFSDRSGIVKLGKWKEARKKCIESNLEISPESTVIRQGLKKGKEKLQEVALENRELFLDGINRFQREQRIKLLTERIATREERREKKRNDPAKLNTIRMSDDTMDKLKREIACLEDKLKVHREGLQVAEEQNKVLFAPSGSEKSRRIYFESVLSNPTWRNSGNERAAQAKRVQLSKKLEPLGWVTTGISGVKEEPDPNEKFRYITYTSDKNKASSGKAQKKEDVIGPALEKDLETKNKLLKSEALNNKNLKEFQRCIILSSGDEEEIQSLKEGANTPSRFPLSSIEIRMPTKPKVELKPTVIVMNVGNVIATKDKLTQDEFKLAKRVSNRVSNAREKSKAQLSLNNRFAVLEYDDEMFAKDVGLVMNKVGNLVECFKNVPLYKHIEKKKNNLREESNKLVNKAIVEHGEDFSTVTKREQRNLTKRMQARVRPHIYKTYALVNSLNTLKKALFCARNSTYPTVNKRWADGVPVTLKRCQWHYLISTCRIALGLVTDSEIEEELREAGTSNENKFKKWVDETLF